MNAVDVKRFIKGLHDLSTIPALLGKILSIIRDEKASSENLYQLISGDPALAGRVIRVANSAIFGHSGDMRDIKQAILLLGYERIKSIALGMSVMDVFPYRNSFNLKNLWIHSYETAFLAEAVSEMTLMASPGECFLSALLHDVGRIIFYRMNPRKFFELCVTDDLLERETRAFGCTHAETGAWFAEETDLPEEIIFTLRFHHTPSLATDHREDVSITSLAEALTRKFDPKIEDDGIWTGEQDAILLKLSLTSENLIDIGQRFFAAQSEIENFFDARSIL